MWKVQRNSQLHIKNKYFTTALRKRINHSTEVLHNQHIDVSWKCSVSVNASSPPEFYSTSWIQKYWFRECTLPTTFLRAAEWAVARFKGWCQRVQLVLDSQTLQISHRKETRANRSNMSFHIFQFEQLCSKLFVLINNW